MNIKTASRSINLLFHTVILFIIISGLFFFYISFYEGKFIETTINNLIDSYTTPILKDIDIWDKKQTNGKGNINWKYVETLGNKITKQTEKIIPYTRKNNRRLYLTVAITLLILIVITILVILYFTKYKGYNINIGRLFKNTLIVFLIVSTIDSLFYYFIATNYKPVTREYISNIILDKFRDRLSM